MWLVKVRRIYRVRLILDRDLSGVATMTKLIGANSAAEARELARLELSLTPLEAARRLTVEEHHAVQDLRGKLPMQEGH